MPTISMNQAVDVHWNLPSAQSENGLVEGDEITRTFDNLIPACEFAVAMANEGNLNVSLYPDSGPTLTLDDARKIKAAWEYGKTSLEAQDIEY